MAAIDLSVKCKHEIALVTCAYCSHIRGPGQRVSYATWESTCKGCGEPIGIGDMIHRPANKRQGWYGECCVEPA